MANIKFPRKEVEKHIKLTPENLDKIMMMGIPVESLSADEIEIQVLPNRPDLLSMHGFLRAIKAFIGKETGLKKYKILPREKNYKVKIDPSLKNIRPFTACAIVKNLKFNNETIKEIIDIQEKIHTTLGRNRKKLAIGIYPLEKMSLPIKYEARAPKDINFIPLESDKEMNGLEILQRHPTGRDYAHLLQDLDKFPVFVDAKHKVLSMPPIINSHETGKITETTNSVFIECSGFDLDILKKTLNIIVTTLADLGGRIYSMELDYGKKEKTPDLSPETLKISLENTNKLLGLNLKEKDLEKLLPKMGYDYKSGKVLIPAWRTDILHEVDIIEDIAIAYGYENMVPEIPKVATIGEESKESKVISKISEILIGLGLQEISTYNLIKAEEINESEKHHHLEVLDSKTDYKYLRSSLLVPAMRIFSENKDNEYPQKIFEIGNVFNKDSKSESGVKEQQNLLIALSPGNFTEIKQTLDYLFKMIDIKYGLKESHQNSLIEGRTGSIILNDKAIGHLGEVHPDTLKTWNLKMPASIIEISLEEIIKSLS
jgi:phenylalanyl-tRNA synthetase beta chain